MDRLKKKITRTLVCILLTLFSITNVCAAPWVYMDITYNYAKHIYSAESVYLLVNGKLLDNLTMPPIIMNGNTLVPAREAFEPLGAIVDWKKETEEIYIAYGDNIICLKVGNKVANVNGKNKTLSTPPMIINNKTMIPVRFISEAVGLKVGWDNSQRIITIDAPAAQTTQDTTIGNNGIENTTQSATIENTTESTTVAAISSGGTNITATSLKGKDIDKSKYLKCKFSDNFDYDKANHQLAIANRDLNPSEFKLCKGELLYTITLNTNINDTTDFGIYEINDDKIDSIIIEDDNKKSKISFILKTNSSFEISEGNGFFYITAK